MSKRPVVVVVGASSKHDKGNKIDGKDYVDFPPSIRWGLGGSLALPFAEDGYDIVLMGRRMEVLREVSKHVTSVHESNGHTSAEVACIRCDLTDETSVKNAFDAIVDNGGGGGPFPETSHYIDLVIFNVGAPFPPGSYSFGEDSIKPHEIDTTNMSMQFDVQVNGLVRVCRHVVPGMIERNRGCILLSGATMQLRGGANFGAIAPAKTAQRSLGQCMFQRYGSMGIHVCNMNIDGVIDSPNTRNWMPIEKLMNPYDIAKQYYNAYKQPPTVWSYEIMISPGISSAGVGMRM